MPSCTPVLTGRTKEANEPCAEGDDDDDEDGDFDEDDEEDSDDDEEDEKKKSERPKRKRYIPPTNTPLCLHFLIVMIFFLDIAFPTACLSARFPNQAFLPY